METKIVRLGTSKHSRGDILAAAQLIKRGSLVAFPTETVYGLGASALDPKAIKKIFLAKGRPQDNPLIVHIACKNEVYVYAREVPPAAKKLIRNFWPGPLTLVLKKSSIIPDAVTAGLDSVAIRMPANKIALSLIRAAQVPIAAPSANISGAPSPTTAGHVFDDLKGKIPLIIDGGSTDIGLESTVIDLTSETPTVLRPGRITLEQLKKVLGDVRLSCTITGSAQGKGAPRSPGMKYRHYSPKARVVLVSTGKAPAKQAMQRLYDSLCKDGKQVGVIGMCSCGAGHAAVHRSSLAMARSLFNDFREMDCAGVDIIIVQGVPEKGIGLALMNRLKKAASEIIL